MIYEQFTFQMNLCFIFGIIAAGFAMVFDFCLQQGKILDWYYDIIRRIKNEYLFNWLGGCTICFSFTFISIPIWVIKYLNFGIDGIWINILLLFIQYSITFVVLYVYFWAEEIVKLHKKKLEYDIQRTELLQRRLSGCDKGNNAYPDTSTTSTTFKAKDIGACNSSYEAVDYPRMF